MDKNVKRRSGDHYPNIVYQPKEVKENQIWRFRKFVENIYGLKLNDYWDLYEWSRQNYPEFWECVWKFFGIKSSEPYTEVFDKNGGFENTDWFKGAKLNFAENILRIRSSKTAIITADQYDNVEHISYEQLYTEVAAYAEALRDLGVKKGDVVTCYMSNKVEAVYAYLATASIGAQWCAVLPLLAVNAVVSRFEKLNPKVLFAAGNFHVDGREIEMVQKIPNIVKSLSTLQKVVFIPSKHKGEKYEDLPGCVFVEEFLKTAREKIRKCGADMIFEQVPFNNPLCIMFTSGTTSAPKVVVHSHGSFLGPVKDVSLFWDCTSDDVVLNITPVGWATWNIHVSTLFLGITVVLYEGNPFGETPTRFWDIVDKFGITCSFIRSAEAERMMQKKYFPSEKHSLSSLKALFPYASVCKSLTLEFLTKDIKPELLCCSAYGSTEYLGMLSGLDSNLPVYKGEIQACSLGYDLRTVDERGNYIVGKRGNLVQVNPTPITPVSSFDGYLRKRLKEMYLTKYPGTWDTGDEAWINPVTKGFILHGRSDDIMKPKGVRFNCTDIYFALEGFPGIEDCVCVPKLNSDLDEQVILFVKMATGQSLTPEVEDNIRKTVQDYLSSEHVPDLILEAPGVPYNIIGKKLNNLVKKLVNNEDVPNAEIVLNPSVVGFFKNLDLDDF